MQLAEISIRRPVFATVLSLLILLIGAVSFNRLTVREYPKIDEPVVTVSVRYAGASAEVIESQVTKPLEDSIAGIDGVDVITSISRAEQGQASGIVASLAGASYIYAPALGVWLYGHSDWLGFGLIVALCLIVLVHGWFRLQADRDLTRS